MILQAFMTIRDVKDVNTVYTEATKNRTQMLVFRTSEFLFHSTTLDT